MNKIIIVTALTFSAILSSTVSRAEAIGTGTLNDFSSGSALSSTDMNTNFSVVRDAVNASNALKATLPAGKSTYLSFYVARPFNYTSGQMAFDSYWSGCEGDGVRLGVSTRGYNGGDNSLRILTQPSLYSVFINTPSAGNFTIKSVRHVIPNGFTDGLSDYSFMVFTLSRMGADTVDTCGGDLRLWGASISYPSTSISSRIFIPAHAMTR